MATTIINNFLRPYKPLTFTVDTRNTSTGSSASNAFTMNIGAGTFNYLVNWGDGVIEAYNNATSPTHVYATSGIYQVKVSGVFARLRFNNGGDRLKILSIDSWGDVVWGDAFLQSFDGCANLGYLSPNTTNAFKNVIRFDAAFRNGGALLVPPRFFSNSQSINYNNAFGNSALSQSSVDNALISINESAQTNNLNGGTIGIGGGTNATPSATGQSATDALRARGWTVTLNGY